MPDSSVNTSPLAGSGFIQNAGLLKKRWFLHLLFWFSYYALTLLLYLGLHEKMTLRSYTLILVNLFFQAIFVYVNLYLLIPRLLFEKKYVWYVLTLILDIFICAIVILFVEYLNSAIEHQNFDKSFNLNWSYLSIIFVTEVYVIGMSTGAKFLKDSFLNQQWMKEKEKHYLETELKFLRSQIHPHFFFNTLNNIYSLTLKKSDEAPGIILKLSDLMSYMLYESNVAQVPLSKEINYLQNYLEVEKLRFGQRLSVSFTRTGSLQEVNIPPMILILFLENSFKHGVKNNINKIHIEIFLNVDIDKGFLYFKVDNPVTGDEDPADGKGIGLRNVRRRLDLLFGDNYTLDIVVLDGIFSVSLKMPLC